MVDGFSSARHLQERRPHGHRSLRESCETQNAFNLFSDLNFAEYQTTRFLKRSSVDGSFRRGGVRLGCSAVGSWVSVVGGGGRWAVLGGGVGVLPLSYALALTALIVVTDFTTRSLGPSLSREQKIQFRHVSRYL